MERTDKETIRTELEKFVAVKGSQNKAANALTGVSAATVSQIINGNWESISDEMWRSLSAQLNVKNKTWNIVETTNYKDLTEFFTDAQENSLAIAITGDAGCGKTLTAETYSHENQNVFVLSCSEYWNRKTFMQELLRAMGRSATGDTLTDMMADAIGALKRMELPLIILDEADKLNDQTMHFFITLYNKLEDQCGIVLMATDYLQKRIERGVRLNKKGYKEIFSRIGRRFIALEKTSDQDIIEVCMANGIESRTDLKTVVSEADADLRRVKRKVFALNKKNARKSL